MLGGLIGAAVGGAIGAQLDAQSAAMRQQAMNRLAERSQYGRSQQHWSNPNKGTAGQLKSNGPVEIVNGRQCMNVTERVSIQGEIQEVEGTRCLDGRGQWI